MTHRQPLEKSYTMDEAAAELRICRRKLQDLVARHPHYHTNGRRKLFTESEIAALRAAMRLEEGIDPPPLPPKPYSPRPEEGQIYFLLAPASNRVKIGFAVDPRRRLKAIMTGCPEPAELIGTMQGTRADERALHKRFKHLRVTGEWFRFDQTLSRFVFKKARRK